MRPVASVGDHDVEVQAVAGRCPRGSASRCGRRRCRPRTRPCRAAAGSPPRRRRPGSGSRSPGRSSAAERPSRRACGPVVPARRIARPLEELRVLELRVQQRAAAVREHEANVRRHQLDLALGSVPAARRVRRRGRGLPGRRRRAAGAGGCRPERSCAGRPGAGPRASARGTAPSTAPRSRRTERAPEWSSYPWTNCRSSAVAVLWGAAGTGSIPPRANGWQRAAAGGPASRHAERRGAAVPPRRRPSRSARSGSTAPRAHGGTARARAGRTARAREGSLSWRAPNPESTREQPKLAAHGLLVGACCGGRATTTRSRAREARTAQRGSTRGSSASPGCAGRRRRPCGSR